MNSIDFILGILLLYGFLKGLWNGLFVALASFVSILLGVYVAIKFSYVMKSFLENHIPMAATKIQIAAFALTFLLVIIGVTLLAKVFTGIADFASLGLLNKLLGGIFGMLKMILVVSIFLNLFQKVNGNNTFASADTLDKSILYQPIQKISKFIYPSFEEWFGILKSETFGTIKSV